MNERIRELIIETLGKDGVIDSRAFGHWALSDEQMDKFAELIVRKCAEVVDNDDSSYPYDSFGHKLKQHFGVQE